MTAFTADLKNCSSLTGSGLTKAAALELFFFFLMHDLNKMVDQWVSIYLQSTFMTEFRVKVSRHVVCLCAMRT